MLFKKSIAAAILSAGLASTQTSAEDIMLLHADAKPQNIEFNPNMSSYIYRFNQIAQKDEVTVNWGFVDEAAQIVCEYTTVGKTKDQGKTFTTLQEISHQCKPGKVPDAWRAATEKDMQDSSQYPEREVQQFLKDSKLVEYNQTQNGFGSLTHTFRIWNYDKEEVCLTNRHGNWDDKGIYKSLLIQDLGCYPVTEKDYEATLLSEVGISAPL